MESNKKEKKVTKNKQTNKARKPKMVKCKVLTSFQDMRDSFKSIKKGENYTCTFERFEEINKNVFRATRKNALEIIESQ